MREIRYRGKGIAERKWVSGSLWFDTRNEATLIWSEELEYWVRVDPTTVGQYTGLKDRNDKEIYEGDILLLSDRGAHCENVVVEHGLYGWTFYDPQTATFYSDGSHTYFAVENARFMFGTGKIVGNIHDNPELIGQ